MRVECKQATVASLPQSAHQCYVRVQDALCAAQEIWYVRSTRLLNFNASPTAVRSRLSPMAIQYHTAAAVATLASRFTRASPLSAAVGWTKRRPYPPACLVRLEIDCTAAAEVYRSGAQWPTKYHEHMPVAPRIQNAIKYSGTRHKVQGTKGSTKKKKKKFRRKITDYHILKSSFLFQRIKDSSDFFVVGGFGDYHLSDPSAETTKTPTAKQLGMHEQKSIGRNGRKNMACVLRNVSVCLSIVRWR